MLSKRGHWIKADLKDLSLDFVWITIQDSVRKEKKRVFGHLRQQTRYNNTYFIYGRIYRAFKDPRHKVGTGE